jgi:hypothetical protein
VAVAIPEARAIKNKKGNGDRRRKEQTTALFVAVLCNAISPLADIELLSQQEL